MAHASEDSDKSDAGVPPESPFLWAKLQFHRDELGKCAR